jgi:hypothetical protein
MQAGTAFVYVKITYCSGPPSGAQAAETIDAVKTKAGVLTRDAGALVNLGITEAPGKARGTVATVRSIRVYTPSIY